jgi:hypothetical protein
VGMGAEGCGVGERVADEGGAEIGYHFRRWGVVTEGTVI